MEKIPFQIELNSRQVTGHLSRMNQDGDQPYTWFHIHIFENRPGNAGNYYWGELSLIRGEWKYLGRWPELVPYEEYLGQLVTAWYQ